MLYLKHIHFFRRAKKNDPEKEPEKFYHMLCRKMLLLSSEGNQAAYELSAAAQDVSELNTACHAFVEGMYSLYQSDFSKGLSHLFLAEEIFLRFDHQGGQMAVATILCTCYRSLGQMDKLISLEVLQEKNSNTSS